MLTGTPKKTAKTLLEGNFSIEEYEKVQNRRKERLALWEERNIPVMIEKERELIAFGEEVLLLMKKGM